MLKNSRGLAVRLLSCLVLLLLFLNAMEDGALALKMKMARSCH